MKDGELQPGAMAKALAASLTAAQRRLCAAAEALHGALPAGGIIYSGTAPAHGGHVDVVVTWPGNLMVLEPGSGEIIREVPASDLAAHPDVVRHFLASALRRGTPLLKARFQPPQGRRLVGALGADLVLRVHAAAGGDLLAESEPGKPDVLRAGFAVLTAGDLSPRYT
jgi:hypothetical protein